MKIHHLEHRSFLEDNSKRSLIQRLSTLSKLTQLTFHLCKHLRMFCSNLTFSIFLPMHMILCLLEVDHSNHGLLLSLWYNTRSNSLHLGFCRSCDLHQFRKMNLPFQNVYEDSDLTNSSMCSLFLFWFDSLCSFYLYLHAWFHHNSKKFEFWLCIMSLWKFLRFWQQYRSWYQ